jgi:hypothetical protein
MLSTFKSELPVLVRVKLVSRVVTPTAVLANCALVGLIVYETCAKLAAGERADRRASKTNPGSGARFLPVAASELVGLFGREYVIVIRWVQSNYRYLSIQSLPWR